MSKIGNKGRGRGVYPPYQHLPNYLSMEIPVDRDGLYASNQASVRGGLGDAGISGTRTSSPFDAQPASGQSQTQAAKMDFGYVAQETAQTSPIETVAGSEVDASYADSLSLADLLAAMKALYARTYAWRTTASNAVSDRVREAGQTKESRALVRAYLRGAGIQISGDDAEDWKTAVRVGKLDAPEPDPSTKYELFRVEQLSLDELALAIYDIADGRYKSRWAPLALEVKAIVTNYFGKKGETAFLKLTYDDVKDLSVAKADVLASLAYISRLSPNDLLDAMKRLDGGTYAWQIGLPKLERAALIRSYQRSMGLAVTTDLEADWQGVRRFAKIETRPETTSPIGSIVSMAKTGAAAILDKLATGGSTQSSATSSTGSMGGGAVDLSRGAAQRALEPTPEEARAAADRLAKEKAENARKQEDYAQMKARQKAEADAKARAENEAAVEAAKARRLADQKAEADRERAGGGRPSTSAASSSSSSGGGGGGGGGGGFYSDDQVQQWIAEKQAREAAAKAKTSAAKSKPPPKPDPVEQAKQAVAEARRVRATPSEAAAHASGHVLGWLLDPITIAGAVGSFLIAPVFPRLRWVPVGAAALYEVLIKAPREKAKESAR